MGEGFSCWSRRMAANTGGWTIVSVASAIPWLWGSIHRSASKRSEERRRKTRMQLENGRDPSEVRKEAKQARQADEFEAIARQWWEHCRGTWTTSHAARVLKRLQDNAFGDLGHLPIDEITPQRIIATVRKIEARGALDVASRVNQAIRAVCRFAIQQGIACQQPGRGPGGYRQAEKGPAPALATQRGAPAVSERTGDL